MNRRAALPRYKQIADELAVRITGDAHFDLPSMNELSVTLGVNFRTVKRAIDILAERGMVVCRRGRSIEIAPPYRKGPQASGTVERLYEKIKTQISDGYLRTGDPLPKASYYLLAERISHATLTRIYHKLAHENLIHKRGRSWFAGPQRDATQPLADIIITSQSPVVLLFTGRERDWYKLAIMDNTTHFVNALAGEFLRYGLQTSLILTEQSPAEPLQMLPCGLEQAGEYISSLGKRYAGSLFMSSATIGAELEESLLTIHGFNKPVVFFDFVNAGRRYAVVHKQLRKNYYRMHLDEEAAVNLVVKACRLNGHTGLGLTRCDEATMPWMRRRHDLFVEMCRTRYADCNVITGSRSDIESAGSFADISREVGDHARYSIIDNFKPHTTYSRLVSEIIADQVLGQVAAASRRAVTVLAPYNDLIARETFFILRHLKVDVPDRLSMISFDNSHMSVTFPTATLDFGYSRLGYLAAHAIIGDIQVRTDRYGNVPGQCKLVNRGSLSRPRKSVLPALSMA
ncbi:MAG: GntR family transcriptional regulator [Chitinivibrionales bacterium]|nr:GntR family transcriptional regulator [Chitinivibrionales bacterium]